jgi:hypothetical protein
MSTSFRPSARAEPAALEEQEQEQATQEQARSSREACSYFAPRHPEAPSVHSYVPLAPGEKRHTFQAPKPLPPPDLVGDELQQQHRGFTPLKSHFPEEEAFAPTEVGGFLGNTFTSAKEAAARAKAHVENKLTGDGGTDIVALATKVGSCRVHSSC